MARLQSSKTLFAFNQFPERRPLTQCRKNANHINLAGNRLLNRYNLVSPVGPAYTNAVVSFNEEEFE